MQGFEMIPENKRIPSDLEDIPVVQQLSEELWNHLERNFPLWEANYPDLTWLHTESGPYPRKLVFQDVLGKPYLVIVSEMGSLTLRPDFGKKQSIFYMSLGKYPPDAFRWEDENGNPIAISELPLCFLKAIQRLRSYTAETES